MKSRLVLEGQDTKIKPVLWSLEMLAGSSLLAICLASGLQIQIPQATDGVGVLAEAFLLLLFRNHLHYLTHHYRHV